MKKTIFLAPLFSLFLGGTLTANELDNPEFDTDLSGWSNPSGRPASWDSLDAADSATSGSAMLTNELPGSGGAVSILSQCISIIEGADYSFGAMTFLPTTEPSGTWARVVVNLLDKPDCSGFDPVRSIFQGGFGQGSWLQTSGNFAAQSGELSAVVNLSIQKQDGVEAPASVHFDNAFFIVSLPDEIFGDRFQAP